VIDHVVASPVAWDCSRGASALTFYWRASALNPE
jgi:hypothetical protein